MLKNLGSYCLKFGLIWQMKSFVTSVVTVKDRKVWTTKVFQTVRWLLGASSLNLKVSVVLAFSKLCQGKEAQTSNISENFKRTAEPPPPPPPVLSTVHLKRKIGKGRRSVVYQWIGGRKIDQQNCCVHNFSQCCELSWCCAMRVLFFFFFGGGNFLTVDEMLFFFLGFSERAQEWRCWHCCHGGEQSRVYWFAGDWTVACLNNEHIYSKDSMRYEASEGNDILSLSLFLSFPLSFWMDGPVTAWCSDVGELISLLQAVCDQRVWLSSVRRSVTALNLKRARSTWSKMFDQKESVREQARKKKRRSLIMIMKTQPRWPKMVCRFQGHGRSCSGMCSHCLPIVWLVVWWCDCMSWWAGQGCVFC